MSGPVGINISNTANCLCYQYFRVRFVCAQREEGAWWWGAGRVVVGGRARGGGGAGRVGVGELAVLYAWSQPTHCELVRGAG